jgi:hypothetical protein
VLEEAIMEEIQSRQHKGKPMCSSTYRRKGQATVSKAFARSTLSKIVGHR